MKRTFLVLLLFARLCSLHTMENGSGLSLGVLGIGVSYEEASFNGYFYGRLLNFVYQTDTGLGITLSPVVFYLKEKDSTITFVNGLIFFNTLLTTDERFILGPFASIHAISFNNPLFIEVRSGVTFSFRNLDAIEDSIFNTDLVFVELGYKYNKTNKHGVYIHVGIDVQKALLFLVKEEHTEQYEKQQTAW